MFSIVSPRNHTINKCRMPQFLSFLRAYYLMAEGLTPAKASRASPDTSQVPSTQDTVPEQFLRFYKKPLKLEVDITTHGIDKQKK